MKLMISVILPVYETPYFLLKKCIDSIVNQNYDNFEIIVINDGSIKNFYDKFINIYKKKYGSKIKLINQKNSGPGPARNKGLLNVSNKTDLIWFIDPDDYIIENSFKYINQVFNRNKNIDYFLFNYQNIDNKNKIINFNRIKQFSEYECLHKFDQVTNWNTVWRNVYKRDFLEKNKIFFENRKIKYFEDIYWDFLIKTYTKSFAYSEDVLYIYNNKNPSSAMKQKLSKKFIYQNIVENITRSYLFLNKRNHININWLWNVKKFISLLPIYANKDFFIDVKKLLNKNKANIELSFSKKIILNFFSISIIKSLIYYPLFILITHLFF